VLGRDRRIPYKHGFEAGSLADPRGKPILRPLRVGQAESLKAMTGEYAFFTPALLYLSGLFDERALIDFVHGLGGAPVFYQHRFLSPVFRGLQHPHVGDGWNYTLWGLHRHYWSFFADFMCAVTFSYREKQTVVGIGLQELVIVDPLALDKKRILTADLPRLLIASLGLNSNRFTYALQAGDPLRFVPCAQKWEASQDMQAYADALFGGKDNPVDARQTLLAQERRKEEQHEGAKRS
jgi:hypothetical protein